MTLFDKCLVSFISNAISSYYTGAPQPSLCIADTTPFLSTPIQHSIVQKISHHTNKSQLEEEITTSLIVISHQHHPLFYAPHLVGTFIPLFPSFLPSLSPTASVYCSTNQWTLDELRTNIISLIKNKQQQASLKPTILYLDSFDLFLKDFNITSIPIILQTLLQIPTVSGIIIQLSSDTFSSKNFSSNPIDIFDAITSPFTTLFQTLPPPNTDPQAILSCHVVHRHSAGKITAESVTLRIDPINGKLIAINPDFHHTQSSQQFGSGADLPDALKDLPFNLSLTPHQMQQRAQVELPYAHQGNTTGMPSTSGSGFKLGLLSSTPIPKPSNRNFDEIVDDDEDDEL